MSNDHDDTFDLPEDLRPADGSTSAAGLSHQAVTAALMSAEPDVELPSRGRPGSTISNLLALKLGGNYTRSVLVPAQVLTNDGEAALNTLKREARRSVYESIRKASETDDRKFEMETNVTITPTGAVYVQIITTRTR